MTGIQPSRTRKPSLLLRWGSIALLIAAAFGLLVGVLKLQQIAEDYGKPVGESMDATLVGANVGLGPFIGFVAGMTFLCLLGFVAESPSAKQARAARGLWLAVGGLPDSYGRLISWLTGDRGEEVGSFLLRFRKIDLCLRGSVLLVCGLASVPITLAETKSFYAAGPQGIMDQRGWFAGDHRIYLLHDVVAVETACRLGSRGAPDKIYHVKTSDGRTFDLGDARPVDGVRLDALEEIDRRLPPLVARERIRDWFGPASFESSCISRLAGHAPNGAARARALLRATDNGSLAGQ